jgi:branched-chain amino acid transport system ATP-binding protein
MSKYVVFLLLGLANGAVITALALALDLALEIADRAVVIARGRSVLSGDARQMAVDPSRIEAAYLGSPET